MSRLVHILSTITLDTSTRPSSAAATSSTICIRVDGSVDEWVWRPRVHSTTVIRPTIRDGFGKSTGCILEPPQPSPLTYFVVVLGGVQDGARVDGAFPRLLLAQGQRREERDHILHEGACSGTDKRDGGARGESSEAWADSSGCSSKSTSQKRPARSRPGPTVRSTRPPQKQAHTDRGSWRRRWRSRRGWRGGWGPPTAQRGPAGTRRSRRAAPSGPEPPPCLFATRAVMEGQGSWSQGLAAQGACTHAQMGSKVPSASLL